MYSSVLGRRLNEYVEEMGASATDESLHEELVVARALAMEAMEMADKAVIAAIEAKVEPARLMSIMAIARQTRVDAINNVRDMCLAQSKILNAGKIDMMSVKSLLLQMTISVDESLGEKAQLLRAAGIDPRELVRDITAKLDDVRLPAGFGDGSPQMTTLVPADDEARMMDGTVPFGAEAVA
jgi:hypothetical protein